MNDQSNFGLRLIVLRCLFILLSIASAFHAKEIQALEGSERIRYDLNKEGQIVGIIIEGEIQPGDYDAFVRLVKPYKGDVRTVYLMSPGGAAVEAMKIGRLIRGLKMETIAPMGSPSRPLCLVKPIETKNCTCASACFLLLVSGVNRTGEIMGIHRVYIKHEQLRNLSAKDAVNSSIEIKKIISSYFIEMGVPTAYIDRALSTPSGEIDFLSAKEINKYFNGYIPDYAEWMTAKCGDLDKLYREESAILKNSKFTPVAKTIKDLIEMDSEYKAIREKIGLAHDCQYKVGKNLSKEAFQQILR